MISYRFIRHVCFFLLLMFFPPYIFASAPDVTELVEDVGCPYCDRYSPVHMKYARSIWDMIVFDRKLYLGAGNSSNIGPATNAGPIPVIVYEFNSNQFNEEVVLREEQIDSFYIHDEVLYIPGHDPKESWEFGNFYTKHKGEGWEKKRTIPSAIHTYALAWYDNKMFAGIGSHSRKCILSSQDGGKTWQGHVTDSGRIHAFLQVEDGFYSVGQFYSQEIKAHVGPKASLMAFAPVFEYDSNEGFVVREDLMSPELFFPQTNINGFSAIKIVRPVTFSGKTIYIGAESSNDHQSNPFGVYWATSLARGGIDVQRITLPGRTIPWDLFEQDEKIYLLTSRKEVEGYVNSVWITENFKDWKELFTFSTSATAISFTKESSSYYFGLGSYFEDNRVLQNKLVPDDTGRLLRITMVNGN